MSYDLIFECDYGNREPLKELLKELVSKYDANVMPMAAMFSNNNPYTLELFIVLSFESDYMYLKDDIINNFSALGYKRRTDLTHEQFILAHMNRQFNSCTFLDKASVDMFFDHGNMFFFAERDHLKQQQYSTKYMEPKNMMFISYSALDETRVDEFVSKLNESNVAVWFAKNSIDFGESILDKVQNATDECIGVILFITSSFLRSNWCKLEMETFIDKYASSRSVLLLSIKDSNVFRGDLPPFLRNIKYVDLNDYNNIDDVILSIKPTINRVIKQ